MPRKASTVASVCSRASAVSLGFKDRLGFTRSSSTRANSTYRHRKLPLRRRLSLIDPFYGHTVHFLIHIEVVRVVARPALRRRSVDRRLFSGTLHRCLRAFVALIVSRRRVCTYFSHTIRARPRLATLHPQDIGRRLRLQRAFAPFQVRLELDRIARLPCPFSLSTPLFRVKMANRSSVFARRARARPFVVPRPPVRVVVRARATHRFHHRSTFRPSLAPVSRARDRARIAPRAPAFVVATGAAAFRFDARVIAPRPPSAASAREVVPLRTLASGVAKSHREVTFYHFHNTYYTTLLTYPREIKIVKIPPRTTSRDRSSRRDSHPPSLTLKSAGRPNFSPKSAQMRRTRAARAARAVR